ncbi:MAG: hypothetical protein KGY81_05700, partial [Phycisphaerae bacterium]|nr:hypothetical protein [Phycisphaerae bacterium]
MTHRTPATASPRTAAGAACLLGLAACPADCDDTSHTATAGQSMLNLHSGRRLGMDVSAHVIES